MRIRERYFIPNIDGNLFCFHPRFPAQSRDTVRALLRSEPDTLRAIMAAKSAQYPDPYSYNPCRSLANDFTALLDQFLADGSFEQFLALGSIQGTNKFWLEAFIRIPKIFKLLPALLNQGDEPERQRKYSLIYRLAFSREEANFQAAKNRVDEWMRDW